VWKKKDADNLFDINKWYEENFCSFECLEKYLQNKINIEAEA
jgi:hypothetical protein